MADAYGSIGYLGPSGAVSVSMSGNGKTVDGSGPNVPGFGTPKPESKGNLGRKVGPLTPMSQVKATPVGIVDDDAFGNNEVGG